MISSDASPFPPDVSPKEVGIFRILHYYLVPILGDRGGASAVEYALIMALVTVFIIAGVLAMSGAMGELFTAMGECLDDPAQCIPEDFDFGPPCNQAHENCGNN